MPGGRGRPCRQGLHLLGRHTVGLGLAVAESGDDQILKHLLVGRRQERGVDAHALQFALGAERETDHAAARLTFDFNAPEFLLRFLKLGLNVLRFFHHAHDIHGAISFSNFVGRVDAGIGVTNLIVDLTRRLRTVRLDAARRRCGPL